jgi:hypothetical protein
LSPNDEINLKKLEEARNNLQRLALRNPTLAAAASGPVPGDPGEMPSAAANSRWDAHQEEAQRAKEARQAEEARQKLQEAQNREAAMAQSLRAAMERMNPLIRQNPDLLRPLGAMSASVNPSVAAPAPASPASSEIKTQV